MSQLREIRNSTEQEVSNYLDALDWSENPFLGMPSADEYVIPNSDAISELAVQIQNYSGILLIHSVYSGVGKSTLLQLLLDDFSDTHTTAYISEHNVTPYELVGIVADKIGVGKSSSTKMTEEKIQSEIDQQDKILVGVDEFGLNDPDTLHSIQFLNDAGCKIILTGMTSQYNAIGSLGSEGKAFQRRVSLDTELESFDLDQTRELIEKRIETVSGNRELYPFTDDAVEYIHQNSNGVAGVITDACNKLFTLGAYNYKQTDRIEIGVDLVDEIEYPDPLADTE
jgi:type II secretory pathway predicted ATPase ExeA